MAPLKKKEKRVLLRMNEIEPKEIQWLWYPYLPRGVITVIAGQGGIGKSTIVNHIVAAVTTGGMLPGMSQPFYPKNVVMFSAEDDYSYVLQPRLTEADADLEKIYVPNVIFTLDDEGLRQLDEFLVETGAAIAVIDPLVHYMGGKIDINKMNEVRELMGELQSIARKRNVALIIVHHTRKGKGGDFWERVAGSGDIVNSARSCILVAKSKVGTTVLYHFKHNYSPPEHSSELHFTQDQDGFRWIDPEDLPDPDDDDDGPREPSDSKKPARQKAAAIAFLRDILKCGSCPAKEVEQAAYDQGINPRTLARAKKEVAESYAKREDGKVVWHWRLKPANASPTEGSEQGGK